MKEIKEVMPYWSYLDALKMTSTLLVNQPFDSNQQRSDAVFDLANRLFYRYHKERSAMIQAHLALHEGDQEISDEDVHFAERLKLFADFLKGLQSKL